MADPLSLIGAGASIISSLLTNKSNSDLMDKQLAYNERMMDKQNEYNKPANQIERLKEAGINPSSLGMGQGIAQSGGTSASALPQSLIPQQDPLSGLSNLASAYRSYNEGLSEMSMRELRMKQLSAQIEETQANAAKLNLDANAQSILNKYLDAKEQYALKGFQSDLELKFFQRRRLDKEIETAEFNLRNILPEELKRLCEQGQLNALNADEVLARIANIQGDTAVKSAEKSLLDEETRQRQTENENYAEVQNQYLAKLKAETAEIASRNKLTDEQVYWYEYDVINKHSSSFMGIKFGGNLFHKTNTEFWSGMKYDGRRK